MKTIQGRWLPPCGAHSRCLTYGSWYLPSSLVSLTTAALSLSTAQTRESAGGRDGGVWGAAASGVGSGEPSRGLYRPLVGRSGGAGFGCPRLPWQYLCPRDFSAPSAPLLPARVLCFSFVTLRTQTVVGRPLAPCRQSLPPLRWGWWSYLLGWCSRGQGSGRGHR